MKGLVTTKDLVSTGTGVKHAKLGSLGWSDILYWETLRFLHFLILNISMRLIIYELKRLVLIKDTKYFNWDCDVQSI